MAWIIASICGILGFCGLWLYFGKQDKLQAAQAASAGFEASATQAVAKIAELESALKILRTVVKELNAEKARKIVTLSDAVTWLRESHGLQSLPEDSPSPSSNPSAGLPVA